MVKNLDYELIGDGDTTVVLMHGWGMDKSCFNKVVQRINPRYQILSLDFFCAGKSDDTEDYFDTYEYAYHVFILLNKLKIKNIIFVGHSFGGRIAIILSSVFKVNVVANVLTSSAGLIKFELKKFIKIAIYKLKKFLVKLKFLSKKCLLKYGSSDYKNLSEKNKKIFIKIVNQDLSFLLKKITAKTILVWDKKDEVTPYWICKKFNKKITCSKIVIFKTGKHFSFMYNAVKFAKIINNV